MDLIADQIEDYWKDLGQVVEKIEWVILECSLTSFALDTCKGPFDWQSANNLWGRIGVQKKRVKKCTEISPFNEHLIFLFLKQVFMLRLAFIFQIFVMVMSKTPQMKSFLS